MNESIMKAIGSIANMPKNKWFTLKDLFSEEEWNQLNTYKLGREFKAIMESTNQGKLVCSVLGIEMKPNTTHNGNYVTQQYRRI